MIVYEVIRNINTGVETTVFSYVWSRRIKI